MVVTGRRILALMLGRVLGGTRSGLFGVGGGHLTLVPLCDVVRKPFAELAGVVPAAAQPLPVAVDRTGFRVVR
ncbi:hypothetical protein [Amycolatopsis pigmentata]|uniref:Secreted protein n=1 Tax=Amycolatopsis pigmentata TaxID=450801 RepID=A0ABW5FIF4_9PSEU